MNQVEKATANPDHDFSKFGTGNKETLDIIPKVHLPFALYFFIFFSFSLVQCCGSGMFIPDPGSWFLPIPDSGSRIPDPKTATKERGEKKLVVIAINFTKL
jgi:hypothetical protein